MPFNVGTLIGYSDRQREVADEKRESERNRRSGLAGMFERLAQDESLRPEVRNQYEQRLATVLLTPEEKKLPRGIEAIVTEVPTGIPQQGKGLATPPQEFPATQLPEGIPPLPGMELPGASMQAPTGPASMPARFTPEEVATQERQALRRQLEMQNELGIQDTLNRRRRVPAEPEMVAGELPDGSAYYANRDPLSGEFTDPATGEDLPGFAPMMGGTTVAAPGQTMGSQLGGAFDTDMAGNPVEPDQFYKVFRNSRSNQVVGVLPTVYSEPTVQAYIPGVGVQNIPRSAAPGTAAPRTAFDLSGMPTTGGDVGISLTAPPTVPEATQADIQSTRQAVQELDTIIPELQGYQGRLGPLLGRVTLAEINSLGGMGASTEEIALAQRLRRLLMTQAFENGGKQLTPTEKEEFIALNPALTDTFPQAITKALGARQYLVDKYKGRLEIMPVRIRGQLPVPAELPPLPGAPDRVRVRGPQGQIGTIDRSELEDAVANGWTEAP